jgi:hypothetical protein
VVVKRCPYPAEVEADGLRALAGTGAPVPAVLGVGDHVLVLERVGCPTVGVTTGRASMSSVGSGCIWPTPRSPVPLRRRIERARIEAVLDTYGW